MLATNVTINLHKIVVCTLTSNQSNLTVHIKSKHEGVKYVCNQCDYQATSLDHLRVHIQSKHEGMKYSCIHCHKQYYDSSSLRRHFKTCMNVAKVTTEQQQTVETKLVSPYDI